MNTISIPFSDAELNSWRQSLVTWFEETGKTYPWRETRAPYEILVSELMLQQTRIKTVLERRYFENWLEKFPTPEALAKADEEEILKAWEGLGYYNRARNLQKAAQSIVENHGGEFPKNFDEILALPGVGRYTAGAVSSFAFNLNQPVLDGNVIRILTRAFNYSAPVDTTAGKKQLWDWAERLTDPEKPRSYNSAIMELGQTTCRKGKPNCEKCPISSLCALALDFETLAELPVKSKSTKITEKNEDVVFLSRNREVFLCQESGSKRKGLWRLPILDSPKPDFTPIHQLTYPITRYRVELTVFFPERVQFGPVD